MWKKKIFELNRLREFDLPEQDGKHPINTESSDGCNDHLEVMFELNDSKVTKIRFLHRGCILSRSSMNGLIKSVESKSKDEVLTIINEYEEMIRGNIRNPNLPEDLMVFQNFSIHKSRHSCLLKGPTILKISLNK